MRKLLVVGLALAMLCGIGCTSVSEASTTEKVATACATASASLKVLTVANEAGKLTAEQKTVISAAAHKVEPICGADQVPTLDTLRLQAFTAAVDALSTAALGERP